MCLLLALGASAILAFLVGGQQPRREYNSACLHALGGGAVGNRGNLIRYDPRCTDDLKMYFEADYFAEVRAVSDEAIAYFQQQRASGSNGPGTVVFDIDETALSNMDGFFPPTQWDRFWSWAAAGLGRSHQEQQQHQRQGPVCTRPHLAFVEQWAQQQQQLREEGGHWGHGERGTVVGRQQENAEEEEGASAGGASPRRPLCLSPPLVATRDLYDYLLDHNYTVVFLTGRSEDARAETEANLAAAGYGTRCGAADADAAAAGEDGSRRRRRAQQQQQQGEEGAVRGPGSMVGPGAAAVGAGAEVEAVEPRCWMARLSQRLWGRGGAAEAPASRAAPRCYAELIMREVGDERLASVFKAEARAALAAAGRVPPLVGNIGDQFSDLTGQAAAPASWKLPNPVYTLL